MEKINLIIETEISTIKYEATKDVIDEAHKKE